MIKQITFSNLYSYPTTNQINFESSVNMYAIYGGVGAGKTNLLNIIESISHAIWDKPNYEQLRSNICKFSNSQLIEISIIFVWQKRPYYYAIHLNPFTETIHLQELKHYSTNKFLFKFDGSTISSDFMSDYQTKMLATFDIQTYGIQHYINNLNEHGVIDEIKQLIAIAKIQDYVKINNNLLASDDQLRKNIIGMFNQLGIKLIDIEVISSQSEFDYKVQKTHGEMNSLQTSESLTPQYCLIYEDYQINLDCESSGIQKLFKFFLEINLADSNQFFIPRIIDDIDDALSPDLIFSLLNLYKQRSNRQLLFATKNSRILERKLLPKESFLFLDRESTSSTIRSLASFKNLRSDNRHNWYKMYTEGKFGGYQNINLLD